MKEAKKIVIINQKGGVGKSTVSVNLSYALAKKNYKTLLVDLDPQSHSSCIFVEHIDKNLTVSNLFLDKKYEINDVIQTAKVKENICENLSIIPSSIHLALVAEQVISSTYRETILENHFKKIINDYDFIIEDCPPTLGVITVNAIYTADTIIIPTNYGRYSLDGIADLFNSINEIKEGQNFNFWILRNMFEQRNSNTNQYVEEQLESLNKHLFLTKIRKNESINQAQINGEPVLSFNPSCSGSKDFNNLTEEFLLNV